MASASTSWPTSTSVSLAHNLLYMRQRCLRIFFECTMAFHTHCSHICWVKQPQTGNVEGGKVQLNLTWKLFVSLFLKLYNISLHGTYIVLDIISNLRWVQRSVWIVHMCNTILSKGFEQLCIWELLLWSELGVEEYSQEPQRALDAPSWSFRWLWAAQVLGKERGSSGIAAVTFNSFSRAHLPIWNHP